jgi:hypothetical protein
VGRLARRFRARQRKHFGDRFRRQRRLPPAAAPCPAVGSCP